MAKDRLTKNDPLAETVLTIKMASLLGAIDCPDTYDEAPQELIPALVGAEGVVPGHKHQQTKVQRHLPSLVAGPGDQTEVGHLTNGVIAFGVTDDADESGRGQHLDDEVARTHAARVAEIEAALNSQNAHLEEVLNARHTGRLSRAAQAAISALGQ